MEVIKCQAEIVKIMKHTPRVKVFRMRPETKIAFVPGQFVMLSADGLQNLNKTLVKRSYSIASKPTDEDIEVCIAKVDGGAFSGKIHEMKEGEKLNIEGPYGRFRLKDNENDIVMVAGGAGIAPMMSMLRTLFESKAGQKIHLFFGVRSPEEIIYREELSAMARQHENFELIIGFSEEAEVGLRGNIHEVIRMHGLSPGKDTYVCGPPAMVKAVREVLAELKFSKEDIQAEQW